MSTRHSPVEPGATPNGPKMTNKDIKAKTLLKTKMGAQSTGASRTASSGRDLVVVERCRPATTTDLTSYQGALEPTSREGLSIWAETTKVPPGWTFLGATTDNCVVIYDAIRDFLETYDICVHRVPTSGNGVIEASAKSITGKLLPNYFLGDWIDPMAEHARTKKLKKDHLLK